MTRSLRVPWWFLTTLFLAGCGSLARVDRSRLNHPAMDLAVDRTPRTSALLGGAGEIKSSGSGGACTVCAH